MEKILEVYQSYLYRFLLEKFNKMLTDKVMITIRTKIAEVENGWKTTKTVDFPFFLWKSDCFFGNPI